MNWKRLGALTPFISLAFFLALWWASPVALRSFLEVGFYEFQAPLFEVPAWIRDLQGYWSLRTHSKDELIRAGRDLARLNAASNLYEQENGALKEELARVERLLDLPPLPGYRYERARVLHRELNAWQQQVIIDKGRKEGIFEGLGVIFAGGVAGRISKVYTRSSIVELASSPRFRVAAHIEKNQRPITYQGAFNRAFTPPLGRVKNIPSDAALPFEGEGSLRVLTSRLGGTFPTGLVLGKIYELQASQDGLFLAGQVHLDERLLHLREVVILVPDKRLQTAKES